MTVDDVDCRFRILGPVQIVAAGAPLRVTRRQQLDLVAFLLLHADRVAATAEIIDAMWGEAPPRTASAQIKNMMSALRGALHDGTRALATVDRQPAGYRLLIATGQLDLAVFEARVARARAAGSPVTTAGLLREALSLWRGSVPLAGVRAAFAEPARVHLREQREAASAELFDAELTCANHEKVVPALTEAVAQSPGNERLVAQLMLALYRSGRTTDALGVYRRTRQTLAEEYGLEPGSALRDLERLILQADPGLDLRTHRTVRLSPPDPVLPARPVPGRPVPAQLPLDVRGFAGRGTELATLNRLVTGVGDEATATVVALMGTAGVGKTALAVHWAHQVTGRFPDGQLYVNLRGFHPGAPAMSPAEAVRGFLDAFAVQPDAIPVSLDAQAALYRSLVAGRRVLVVLDNALDTEQIRPLLPGTPECLVMVTSRNRLTGLVAGEGAYPMTLDVLSEVEAGEFLVRRLGADRVAAEARAAVDIAGQCARLPLALAMVAASAAIHPGFPLVSLSRELSAARGKLGGDPESDVWAVFSWSYERLKPAASGLFRMLGLHPGPDIATAAAASLLGQPVEGTRPLLDELARAHLITEHVPGRYVLHDLLRAYAAELARTVDAEADRLAAVRRAVDHYLHTAYAAAVLTYPHRLPLDLATPEPGSDPVGLADAGQAVAWFTTEHAVLLGVQKLAAEHGLGDRTWQLADALAGYLDRRGHWHDWAAMERTGLAAAEKAGDLAGQARASGHLALSYVALQRYDRAQEHLCHSSELLGQLGDSAGQAYNHLFMSLLHDGQGDYAAALRHAEQALDLHRTAGHQLGFAQALHCVGLAQIHLGRYPEAIIHCEQAIALHRGLGDRHGVAHTQHSLGLAHHHLGHHRDAIANFRQALEMLREAGDLHYEAETLTRLGDTQHAAGDIEAAGTSWQQALCILDELGHPDAEAVRARLARI